MSTPFGSWRAACIAIPLVATPMVLQAAQSPTATAKTLLEQGVREAVQILDKEKPGTAPAQLAKKVRPVVEKIFNFESLTRKAMGQSWKDLSPDQQKQAVSLFSEILIRKYAVHFVSDEKPQVSFSNPVDLGGGRLEVPATTQFSGNSIAVLYRMEAFGASWRVYDVSIEGVSLVSNYRSQFDSVRQKSPGNGESIIRLMQENIKP